MESITRIGYYLRMNADNDSCRRRLPSNQVDLVVEVFRMLADSTRVQVLWALVDRELSVNDLAEHVGKPAPSVSQHLAKLRMARLVRTRKEGTQVIYRLENDHVRQLVTDAVFNAEHAGPGVPGHHRTGDDLRILHAERGVDPAPARTEGGRA
ncbi:ArsR family transcriptional regulator [Rhodococcus sp. ENV425]|nr:ArsR family transcriptional regulator [Rhodococcus sp. ENV425]